MIDRRGYKQADRQTDRRTDMTKLWYKIGNVFLVCWVNGLLGVEGFQVQDDISTALQSTPRDRQIDRQIDR